MTMIEGVGDEVVQFMGVLMVFMVGLAAWWSTNARPGRYRTVVVMRPRPHHPVTVNFRSRPNFMLSNTPAISNSSSASQSTTTATETITISPPEVMEEVQRPDSQAQVIPLQEMDSIIDADMAMMNNNRLHFYRRMDDADDFQGAADSTSEEEERSQEEPEPAGNDQIREMDSIVNAMEADVTAGCDFFARQEPNSNAKPDDKEKEGAAKASDLNKDDEAVLETPAESSADDSEDDQAKILIKLKYLNDTLKEVDGHLDELLKDFTWRHFSSELSAQSRVRLIFNGRVLEDGCTLRAAGLHHRAVVHALVHPRRALSTHAHTQQALPERAPMVPGLEPAEGEQRDRSWDLENILMTLVSVALTVVWFFRCEYSNMFTASASVALFGLTVFYSVAVFGLYLSDTFQFERRAAQPQAMF